LRTNITECHETFRTVWLGYKSPH